MICPNCGMENNGAAFCAGCGTKLEQVQPEQQTANERPVSVPTYPTPPRPTPQPAQCVNEYDLPERYRPLSAWAYFGLTILFSIPIVGFIFLIVFSCNSSNINRRNYARSYWCGLLIVAIIIVVIFVIAVLKVQQFYDFSDIFKDSLFYKFLGNVFNIPSDYLKGLTA